MTNILIMNSPNSILNWLTLLAVVVALVVPYIQYYLLNQIKKSKLIIEKPYVCNQDNNANTYYMGRLIIKNDGKFIARLVEPYIKNIETEKVKKFFFPVPLKWMHGEELNKENPSIRDIYPNQSVYLDLFYYDKNLKIAKFVITAGKGLNELEDIKIGENKIIIVFYQENGQVDSFDLKIVWKNENVVPEIIV